MPPLEAERQGYERVNKYPKSTKFGRQNPITARWNSDEQLVVWRENWAQTTNKYLDEANRSDAHIDHRSHAARGIDEQPTIHEGYVAQAMESRGLIADRCEINRQIKADNALLRELKAAFAKISQAVKNTVPTLAKAMESLREKVIVISYHILHTKIGKRNITDYVKELKANYECNKPQITSRYLWVNTTVKRILQNEFYIGTVTCHKTYTSKIYCSLRLKRMSGQVLQSHVTVTQAC